MRMNDSVLRKVRALLAKAEATPFDAEAEAFTAKAQELITRYRIDRLLISARDPRERDAVITLRVDIEAPYLKAKVILLSRIAVANSCRAVWPKPERCVQLFGCAGDLDAVEELFTSLLLQATGAMLRAGSKHDALGRSRTTAFRRAFLLSFARRIGQRLAEVDGETVDAAAAETSVALVPLVAARVAAAHAAALEAFPHTRPIRASVSDAEGWSAGAAFADQADLSTRVKLRRPA